MYKSEESGRRLKEAVMSQMKIYEFIERMGVTRNTVYSWFNGGGMSIYHLSKACELLNVSADFILFGKQIVIYAKELPFSDWSEE